MWGLVKNERLILSERVAPESIWSCGTEMSDLKATFEVVEISVSHDFKLFFVWILNLLVFLLAQWNDSGVLPHIFDIETASSKKNFII